MTEDALAEGDRLITMVQQRGDGHGPESLVGVPAIEEIACLGRIFQHQRLSDGRFNLLLLGLKRVRLIREVPTEKLYRVAEAETLEDQDPGSPEGDRRRNELHSLFQEVVSRTRPNDADLVALVEASLPLGPLTDLVAYTLGLPVELKQRLLAEARVAHRADTLMEILGRILAHHPRATQGATFPPPFSSN